MKRLLAALLPAVIPCDAREHVLGDLAQRGYRWADIFSVLPRVWWSHAVRLWNGSVPALTAASESQVRHRARQFARRRLLAALVGGPLFLGAMCLTNTAPAIPIDPPPFCLCSALSGSPSPS